MIDFTELPRKRKAYAGANGSKIAVVYRGEQYMLKFPPLPSRNKEMSYTNSCISEYIGCHIFESVGIPTQETILGTYRVNGKEKVCVACRDFTSVGVVLQDFASLKNQIIDSERNGYGTELADILRTFSEQETVDSVALEERFWDMFIVDALIGNWDRHNGNWGFLYDTREDTVTLAPVFDCGSSLFPQADEQIMEAVLRDRKELNYRVFEIPTSSLMLNGKRINYHRFLTAGEYTGCNAALQRIVPRIDMDNIQEIVLAPYCRVSTDSEEQRNSYAAQIEYYQGKVSENPEWTLVRIYADEGITGTSMRKRKEFLKLMEDCKKGKIDLVITKSVTRFARNTLEGIQAVRDLRRMGIGVYFEKENTNTLYPGGTASF